MNRNIRPFRLGAVAAAGAFCLASLPAHASVIFTLGNNGGFSTINLNTSSSPSTTVTGTVNPVPPGNPTVNFTSSEPLLVPGGGQSRIEAQTGLINDLTITLASGGTFEGFVFNPFQPANAGDLVVQVTTNTGTEVYDTATYGSPNGNNFLTITTDAAQSIQSIRLSSTGGFGDLRQPRIIFADQNGGGPVPPSEIPEPGSVALLGLALGAAAWARRRRGEAGKA